MKINHFITRLVAFCVLAFLGSIFTFNNTLAHDDPRYQKCEAQASEDINLISRQTATILRLSKTLNKQTKLMGELTYTLDRQDEMIKKQSALLKRQTEMIKKQTQLIKQLRGY